MNLEQVVKITQKRVRNVLHGQLLMYTLLHSQGYAHQRPSSLSLSILYIDHILIRICRHASPVVVRTRFPRMCVRVYTYRSSYRLFCPCGTFPYSRPYSIWRREARYRAEISTLHRTSPQICHTDDVRKEVILNCSTRLQQIIYIF